LDSLAKEPELMVDMLQFHQMDLKFRQHQL
jgi:hypothetical protein